MSTLESRAEIAALPFSILEGFNVGTGYERSFKLSAQKLESNRYMLGVNLDDLQPAQVDSIIKDMKMPSAFAQDFRDRYKMADTLLLGFDEAHGGILKCYLEFFTRVKDQLHESPSHTNCLLHRGYKWTAGAEKQKITDYFVQPRPSLPSIESAITEVITDSKIQTPLLSLLEKTKGNTKLSSLIFLRATEANSQRQSYDLNLYPANLRLGVATPEIQELAAALGVDREKTDTVLNLTTEAALGHISFGLADNESTYVTFYYEGEL